MANEATDEDAGLFDHLRRRLAHQISARREVEALLRRRTLELHDLNQSLLQLNASLEERVTERTRELERERQRAMRLAENDPLTGLPNRLKFRQHLQQVLDTAAGTDSIAVLYLDVDGFKKVNHIVGHLLGDELVCAVGRRLSGYGDERTLICHFSGDEFAIIQVNPGPSSDITALADRIIADLRRPFSIGAQSVRLTASLGIAIDSRATASVDGLLHGAGTALLGAKRAGRDQWALFQPEMEQEIQERRQLEKDLGQALAQGQLRVAYQALVEAVSGRLVGFEALMRWQHPLRGMVPPSVFIPIAEEIGLIHALGAWVLKQACADAACWPSGIKVAVNLSPAQFTADTLLTDIVDALETSGLAPNRLELEITESVLLQENQATLTILQQLRRIGTRLSMDDFGTGYSSLSYVNRFPFDKIKIDRSFVENVGRENGGLEIIRAVIGLGKALRITVLAEGVETEAQWRFLRDEGCDELQGYLFSKPKPVHELNDLLAGHADPDGLAPTAHPWASERLSPASGATDAV